MCPKYRISKRVPVHIHGYSLKIEFFFLQLVRQQPTANGWVYSTPNALNTASSGLL